MPYISVTGLKLRSPRYTLHFWWYAIRSFEQAKRARGFIDVKVTTRKGYHHTLSVWTSRADMLEFMRSGPHLGAMKIFQKIATGKTIGFESETTTVDWKEALEIWEIRGKES